MEVTTEYMANVTEENVNLNYHYMHDRVKFLNRLLIISTNVRSVIWMFGIVFNTLALLVLLKSKELRRKSMGKLLIALSLADNYVMLGKKKNICQC